MLPQFLLPETIAREDGVGGEVQCDDRILNLTLGITRVVAEEMLEVSVWGSADCKHWRHLVSFPQKFYCGVYLLVLDLTSQVDVRYLRAQWRMERWAREERVPIFGFYLRAEAGRLRRKAGAA
jgi:hypothetical protein